MLPILEHGDDIGMETSCGRDCLALETCQQAFTYLADQQMRVQGFYRDAALDVRVVSFVDDAGRALAQQRYDFILTDISAYFPHGVGGWSLLNRHGIASAAERSPVAEFVGERSRIAS